MSPVMVVDASVALKWVLPPEEEPEADKARSLLLTAGVSADQVLVPPHFYAEVLNVLHRRTERRNAMAPMEAADGLSVILRMPLVVHSPAGLYARAFNLAQEYRLPSGYDALYIAVAESAGCDLWTDDRRLLGALDGGLAYVRWIGDWP